MTRTKSYITIDFPLLVISHKATIDRNSARIIVIQHRSRCTDRLTTAYRHVHVHPVCYCDLTCGPPVRHETICLDAGRRRVIDRPSILDLTSTGLDWTLQFTARPLAQHLVCRLKDDAAADDVTHDVIASTDKPISTIPQKSRKRPSFNTAQDRSAF